MSKSSLQPSTKVTAVGVSGALSVVLIYAATQFGLELPPEVASAVTVIVSFAAGYWIKER